jgi:hypothetical protein
MPLVKPLDKVFWVRASMGVISGAILGFVTHFTGLSGTNGILFAMLMYILSYYIARFTAGTEIPQKDTRKLVTSGLGSFILLFLFVWILITTLFTTGF